MESTEKIEGSTVSRKGHVVKSKGVCAFRHSGRREMSAEQKALRAVKHRRHV